MAKLTTKVAKGKAIWHITYLASAKDDAKRIFTDDVAYSHAVSMVEQLAYEKDPTHSQTQDVKKIGEFYELKVKGGMIGKINLRIYFALVPADKLIHVLSVFKKENDGKAPKNIIKRIKRRYIETCRQLKIKKPKTRK